MRLLGPIAVVFVATSGMAQEQGPFGGVSRSLEMPAHRSLVSLMKAADSALAPFETDGCSGGMSWSWRVVADVFPDFEAAQGAHPPWETCCVTHDRAYHDATGAKEAEASFDARLAADTALKLCVADPGAEEIDRIAAEYQVPKERVFLAYSLIADAMYNAVRFGGGPCSGLPWRWGFGYPGCVPGF